MKKILIILFIFLLVGCSEKKLQNEIPKEEKINKSEENIIEEEKTEEATSEEQKTNIQTFEEYVNSQSTTSNSNVTTNNATSNSSHKENNISNNTIKNEEITGTKSTKINYRCEYGYVLKDSKCYYTYSPSIEYTCSSGVLSGTLCVTRGSYSANYEYSCLDGYNLEGSTCVKKQFMNSFRSDPNASESQNQAYYNIFRNSCVGTVEGNNCYYYYTVEAYKEYRCNDSSDTLILSTCYINKTDNAERKYVCNSGGTLNAQQLCEITKDAIAN